MGMLREWFLLLRPPPANMFGWRVPSLDPLELVKWDALCLWCTNLLWWLKHIWTQRKNKSVRFDQLSFGCGGRIQNVWDQPERSLVVYPVHPHFTWLNQLDSSCSFLNSQVHRMSLTSPVKTWAPNGRFAAGRPHGAIPSWLENVAESCSMPLCFKKTEMENPWLSRVVPGFRWSMVIRVHIDVLLIQLYRGSSTLWMVWLCFMTIGCWQITKLETHRGKPALGSRSSCWSVARNFAASDVYWLWKSSRVLPRIPAVNPPNYF